MLDLSRLRVLVAVARERSVTAAAEALLDALKATISEPK
jgi:hypothetical protein